MFRHQLMNALCLGSYDRLIWPHCDASGEDDLRSRGEGVYQGAGRPALL
jgi:hypothetical protein